MKMLCVDVLSVSLSLYLSIYRSDPRSDIEMLDRGIGLLPASYCACSAEEMQCHVERRRSACSVLCLQATWSYPLGVYPLVVCTWRLLFCSRPNQKGKRKRPRPKRAWSSLEGVADCCGCGARPRGGMSHADKQQRAVQVEDAPPGSIRDVRSQ